MFATPLRLQLGLLWLPGERPAQAERYGSIIELALNGIFPAAHVEPEGFIGHVQQGDDCLRPMATRNPVAHLSVNLSMRIEVSIAVRPLESAVGAIGRRVAIAEDVGVVVSYANASGEAFFSVGQIEVCVIGRLAQQCRVI